MTVAQPLKMSPDAGFRSARRTESVPALPLWEMAGF